MFGLRFWRRAIGAFGAADPRQAKVRRLGVESLEDRSLLSISGGSLISQTSLVSSGILARPNDAAIAAIPAQQPDAADNSWAKQALATPTFKRQLLTGNVNPFAGSTSPSGLSPSQIRQAYAFNQVTFSNGTVQGDGSGQTIAIVDAYNDPNIVSDLASFDQHFGIPAPPTFKVVAQNGSTSLPPTDPAGPGNSWAVETSLDVEWAHALAPGASILLVEANSNSFADLVQTAVPFAAAQPGVLR